MITKTLGLPSTTDFGAQYFGQNKFLWLRDQLGFIDGAIVDTYTDIEAK